MFQTQLTRRQFSAKPVSMTIDVFPDEINVLEACGRLVDFNPWEQTKIDPEGWLSNFSVAERRFALIF